MVYTKLAVFEGKNIRRIWDDKQEKWYFSVVDIIQILIGQPDGLKARKYWNKLAERLRNEGSESVTNCHRLKLEAADGKNILLMWQILKHYLELSNLFRLLKLNR